MRTPPFWTDFGTIMTAGADPESPPPVLKLEENHGDLAALTMAEMSAIAFTRFNGQLLKGNKQSHIDALGRLITSQPNALALAAPAPPTLALTMAPVPTTIAPAPALEVAPGPNSHHAHPQCP